MNHPAAPITVPTAVIVVVDEAIAPLIYLSVVLICPRVIDMCPDDVIVPLVVAMRPTALIVPVVDIIRGAMIMRAPTEDAPPEYI